MVSYIITWLYLYLYVCPTISHELNFNLILDASVSTGFVGFMPRKLKKVVSSKQLVAKGENGKCKVI